MIEICPVCQDTNYHHTKPYCFSCGYIDSNLNSYIKEISPIQKESFRNNVRELIKIKNEFMEILKKHADN